MNDASMVEFADLQGLLRFGYRELSATAFMLLDVADAQAARQWLQKAPVSNAVFRRPSPETALHIAFSVEGLRALGVAETILEGFSDEFLTGMAGDENRSRRLGDVARNAPPNWAWGGEPGKVPHVLLLLYATGPEDLAAWQETAADELFARAFGRRLILPTDAMSTLEPFGFADGISQPKIDWDQRQSTDLHARDSFSNLVAPGEFVLGYPNEYGMFTARPLVDPQSDRRAAVLPSAADEPALRDFGRNGSYLVIRQLHQDVPGFWQFIDQAVGGDAHKREALAAQMVGRELDGTPLAPRAAREIPGLSRENQRNYFTYELDPRGHRCPIGAHVRRVNPRTGDFPPVVTGLITRLIKMLGFGQSRDDDDLIASTRFHRLLRRGRGYGPLLEPEAAIKPDAPAAERGLQFIALAGNILRQFEFVQNAWSISTTFAGLQQESDPLIGVRQPLVTGEATANFNRSDPAGPRQQTCGLPQFVTVRGGGYFFMPGLRALQFIAASPAGGGEGRS